MKFFIQMFSGEAGRISSKRGVMVWLLLLFTFVIMYNAFTGKAIAPTYSEQLFEVLCLSLITVFGEKWVSAWFAMKAKSKTSVTEDKPKEEV